MVILQPAFPTTTSANLHPKLPSLGGKQVLTFPPRLSASSQQQPERPTSSSRPANCQSVAAIVFGDGSESQLYPLTKRRSEGAIHIAGSYRLIDAVVSNCINSNITKIYALTQYNSTSLNSHLCRAYSGVGIEVVAAYQSPEARGWFQGTADAVRKCLWLVEDHPVAEFLVLPGYHLYRMNYQKLIQAHQQSNADVTIVALSAEISRETSFGFLEVNSENQVVEFSKRSGKEPATIISGKSPRKSSNDNGYKKLASTGIYVVKKEIMIRLLNEHFPHANGLGSEVIPGAISKGMKVEAYAFDGYWEDMRNIEAFYKANMESTKKTDLGYNFYDRDSPLYTLPRNLPPTLITDAVITDSIIGDGCILNGCEIRGTIVGLRTKIGERAVIEDSMIMGSDFYQPEDELSSGMKGNGNGTDIPIGIGEDAHIRRAIVDKNARIGRQVLIMNRDNVQEGNREGDGYIINGGIVVVLKNAMIPDGSIL